MMSLIKGGLLLFSLVSGSAGLYCLSCTDSVTPRHCRTVQNCGDGEVCFTESHFSQNGNILFDLGCRTSQTCQIKRRDVNNQQLLHRLSHHSHCIDCCSTDLCNNQGCGQRGYPTSRGPVCFECQQVSNPLLCDKITFCDQDQECYLERELEFGDVFYSSRCINKHACASNLQVFGKRNTDHCSHCCHTDLCNNQCVATWLTLPATMMTSTPLYVGNPSLIGGASLSSSPITTETIPTLKTTTKPLNAGGASFSSSPITIETIPTLKTTTKPLNAGGASFSSSPITIETIPTLKTTTKPLNAGSQGEEFLIVFMRNHDASGRENTYILAKLDDWSSVDITSSPHLEYAIRSNVDNIVNFTSEINISFPSNLTCQYSSKESKAVLFKTSSLSTVIIFDSSNLHTNDATIIIPIRKLSTDYLVSTTFSTHSFDKSQFAVGSLHSETHLQITFNLKYSATLTLFGMRYSTGDTFSISLEKFETLQIGYDGDLSGTFVTANKPIALFSGNRCQNFSTYTGCNHMVSQLPPTREYDNEYIIPCFFKNIKTLSQVISPVRNIVHITIGTTTTTMILQAHEYHNFEISPRLTSTIKAEHPVQVTGFAMGSDTNDPYMTVIPE
ncbi:uncharacterized protein LOC111110903 isoform X2 [Crassostrea virginica]